MKRIKILFLIHDLGQGGAEKVLVNLVNNIDGSKYDITVTALFGGGVNEQFLNPDIKYGAIFKRMIPANSIWMKALTPRQLHTLFIKGKYDIEVSFLEGPSARVISGCTDPDTKLACWIHSNHFSQKEVSVSFRSMKEARNCYRSFNKIVCVSEDIKDNFCRYIPVKDNCKVLYNTLETERIRELTRETGKIIFDKACINLISVGTLKKVKGFERLLTIIKRLREENYNVCLYLLGRGPLESALKAQAKEFGIDNAVFFLGYQINPYKYLSECDIYVSSSYSEGFSTAVSEALIVGIPVCTTDVSGMRELLGANNDYGIVTKNSEESLYQGIKLLLDNKELLEHYKKRSFERGLMFSKEKTIKAVEKMFEGLLYE